MAEASDGTYSAGAYTDADSDCTAFSRAVGDEIDIVLEGGYDDEDVSNLNERVQARLLLIQQRESGLSYPPLQPPNKQALQGFGQQPVLGIVPEKGPVGDAQVSAGPVLPSAPARHYIGEPPRKYTGGPRTPPGSDDGKAPVEAKGQGATSAGKGIGIDGVVTGAANANANVSQKQRKPRKLQKFRNS